MHKRQAILDAVSQALDAMGVDADMDADDYGENMEVAGENTVPIWSQLEVGVEDAGRGPIHDKSALFKGLQMSKPPQLDNYGMPVDDEAAEMSVAMGLV